MAKASEYVIVIGRTFGSGGRQIGRALAQRLGVPYYDRELLSQAATRLGLRPDLLERADEKPPTGLRSLLGASVGAPGWFTPGALHSEAIYQAQCDVIEAIVAEGSCVIVGRTADYVARNHPGLVSVFLHAPIEHRLAQVASREGDALSQAALRDKVQRADARRREYYNYFTGRNWGHASNYHLSLDTSLLGQEGTLLTVEAYMRARGLITLPEHDDDAKPRIS